MDVYSDLLDRNLSKLNKTNDKGYLLQFGFENSVYEDIPEIKIFAIIFLIIFVTGIVGNALVVFVFARNKAFRTLTNIYLLNLAVVDLIYLVACCPFTTTKVVLAYWPFGDFACKFIFIFLYAHIHMICKISGFKISFFYINFGFDFPSK